MLDSGSAPAVCGRFARSDQYRGTVANIKQQKKRVKVAARERLENLRYRSAIKTYFRRLGVAVDAGDADAVATEHRELVRLIDRAGAKRALHPGLGDEEHREVADAREEVVRLVASLDPPR
jgi:small subunit ribosomal protein S20